MAWKVETADLIEADLEVIFNHLVENHRAFGNSVAESIALAEQRVDAIFATGLALDRTPYRGTRHLYDGLEFRHTTINRAIYWFRLDESREVIILEAIFHGGQDHMTRIMDRLAQDGGSEGA